MVRKSKKLLTKTEIHQLEDPDVKCTRLPEFIRAKKYLGAPFCVYFENGFNLEGVKVIIAAGNYKNPNAELKNNESFVKNGVAEFQDLRFLGKSGRGTKFNVYIKLETNPPRIITYHDAIKVTVDGPRPPRNIKPKIQEALKTNEDIINLKRKYETQYYYKNNYLLKNSINHNSKLTSNQPIKKRIRQCFSSEEESIFFYSPLMSHTSSTGACSSSSVSLSSSPPISPNSSLELIHESSSLFMANKSSSCLLNCCSSLQNLSLEQINQKNVLNNSQDINYKGLLYKYLVLFMDMYKLKINEEMLCYLVDMIYKEALSQKKSISNEFLFRNDSACSSSMSSTCLNDEQFLYNFQLFYSNLMQNYGN